MPVGLLRFFDYWIGIPLCVICSMIHAIRRGTRGLFPKSAAVKKVLVIKLSELGAIVLSYPFLKELKTIHPQADVYVLTFKKNKEVFNFLGGLIGPDKVLTIDDSSAWKTIKGFAHILVVMREEKFDIAVDLEFFTRTGALLSFFSGARVTAGFFAYGLEGLYRGNFLTHKVAYNALKHVSVNYYALAVALKQTSKTSPETFDYFDEKDFIFPRYKSDPEILKGLDRLGIPQDKKIFLMNAGDGVLPLREWPLENFVGVSLEILKIPSHSIVLVGAETGRDKARYLIGQLNDPRVVDCSGKTSLGELMELFLMGRAVIANDCGLVHLAMLTPIKKIVLFGPETPQVFGPLTANVEVIYSHWPCSPCLSAMNHRNSACRDNQCLKAIQVPRVVEALQL